MNNIIKYRGDSVVLKRRRLKTHNVNGLFVVYVNNKLTSNVVILFVLPFIIVITNTILNLMQKI